MVQRVGVREAKSGLSRLLLAVKRGGEVVITEHGRPVGRLVPVGAHEFSPADLERDLEARGLIAPRRSPARKLPPPIPGVGGIAQRYLQEDRER